MSKQYEKGMEDASEAYEEKFQKQGEAAQKATADSNERMKHFSHVQGEVIDTLEEHQRRMDAERERQSYGIPEVMDVRDLKDGDRELLAGILFFHAIKKENPTEKQKKYAARILNYIGIPNPTLIDIQVVKKVDSLLIQREILRVLVEYEFLECVY